MRFEGSTAFAIPLVEILKLPVDKVPKKLRNYKIGQDVQEGLRKISTKYTPKYREIDSFIV